MSYALMSGPPPGAFPSSSPAGSLKVLSRIPSSRPVVASAFANAVILPDVASAIAYAASFAETTISASSASAKLQRWPCFM